MSTVRLHFLGVFRDLGDEISLSVDGPLVADLRQSVAENFLKLGRDDLLLVLNRSVFAFGDNLLCDSDLITSSEASLLPPIAGG
ncbi:hypothetical protein OAC78_04135 [Litorivicinus sp.]|nr:hypothetical protein [Litorivicinus sp.]MDB9862544.1 hypothetical protein [Litorivicinus sp.]MDC1207783.1 hypothetical protein [Litorivicinus sp.]MDC1240775.1 hypothetical protein [Litorivicinus sp.]